MSWVFLDVGDVEIIHDQSIRDFGGSPGLRDRGLLESAVLRAQNKAAYDPEATTGSIAASLSFGLIKNHAFIDGNKRIGTAALLSFLGLNSARLTAAKADLLNTVLAVASSELSEAEWTTWVEANIAPLHT
jgi:death-on-curing protein